MKFIYLSTFIFLINCQNNQQLELEILTKEIKALNISENENFKYLMQDKKYGLNITAKTIVIYKLKNYSNKTYYLNLNGFHDKMQDTLILFDKGYIRISDAQNYNIKPKVSTPTYDAGTSPTTAEQITYELDYNKLIFSKNKNFVIHPQETLYFKWFIVLPYGHFLEESVSRVKLDNTKQYFAEVLLKSENKNLLNTVIDLDLKTIKENEYEVYDGIIKSKNKIPIKFVDLPKK